MVVSLAGSFPIGKLTDETHRLNTVHAHGYYPRDIWEFRDAELHRCALCAPFACSSQQRLLSTAVRHDGCRAARVFLGGNVGTGGLLVVIKILILLGWVRRRRPVSRERELACSRLHQRLAC